MLEIVLRGGRIQVEFVKIQGRYWPVSPQFAMSRLFFSVIDVTQFPGTTRYYANPVDYFEMTTDFPSSADLSAEDYSAAVDDFLSRKQAFRNTHLLWYEEKARILRAPHSYIMSIRNKRIRKDGDKQNDALQKYSYDADGYARVRKDAHIYDFSKA